MPPTRGGLSAHVEAVRRRAYLKAGDADTAKQIGALIQESEAREQEAFRQLHATMAAKAVLLPDFITDA